MIKLIWMHRMAWPHCTVLQGVAMIRQLIYCWRGVLRSWRKRKTVLVHCTCQSKETTLTALAYFYITRHPLTMSPWWVFHFLCIYLFHLRWSPIITISQTCVTITLHSCCSSSLWCQRAKRLGSETSSSSGVMRSQPIPGRSQQKYHSIKGLT